jgi:hypothetical protein
MAQSFKVPVSMLITKAEKALRDHDAEVKKQDAEYRKGTRQVQGRVPAVAGQRNPPYQVRQGQEEAAARHALQPTDLRFHAAAGPPRAARGDRHTPREHRGRHSPLESHRRGPRSSLHGVELRTLPLVAVTLAGVTC